MQMPKDTEDRLRDLLEQAIAARDQTEAAQILAEFRLALEAHVEYARSSLLTKYSVSYVQSRIF
jgi:hypothetical protein